MKKLLLVLNLSFLILACAHPRKTAPVPSDKESENRREETGEERQEIREVQHGTPDPAALDSMKKAKMKIKKGN